MESGVETRITSSHGDNLLPRFSPNGHELLFMSNSTGAWSIWTVYLNGSSLSNLLDPYQEFRQPTWSPSVDLLANPQWSPNGLTILFVSSSSSESQDAYVLEPNVLVAVDEVGDFGMGLIQTRLSENITGANSATWLPDGSGVVLTWSGGADAGIWVLSFQPVVATNPYGK